MTPDPAAWLDMLPAWSFAFMLVLARCGAAMAILPGVGEAAAPAMVRAGLALGLALLLLPSVFSTPPAMPEAGLAAAGMIVAEVATGLWLGFLARMLTIALAMAAQFIAYLLGISTVLQPDPELGAQTTALSALFEIVAPLLILVSGLYTMLLSALVGSYRLVPAGAILPAGDSAVTTVASMSQAFGLALRLASPFILAAIVWHVAIGLVARMLPRLQIYFVSMPGQIVGGLVLLATLCGGILAAWQDTVRDSLATLPGN